ncbi:MAG TPA: NAD(P)-dependent oxidoreductase [Candidatus Sphingobacterium stercoripullorum]|uniref:NAD(P)-dependent oxidoreductase n=1 Tax=Candidatus Sphingobacterium stercoripullorum TaxID=2838759 RepID=A0A9D2AXU2_9SPHI|nr:NAD(P)-dependent oxidoreductase [Candidatus Sphingobacterium stercoripullorum]
MNPEKVLITGASGFVGWHLIKRAKERGWQIHAAVRPSSKTDAIKPYVDRFIYLNYEDSFQLEEVIKENAYTLIIHAAAMTRAKTLDELIKVNSDYTINLLRAATTSPALKRFVYISSLAAVGPVSYEGRAITEDNPQRPLTIYGESKKHSEERIFQEFIGQNITILRPTAVFGPKEKDLFILFDTFNKGLDPYIGRKPQKLSFIYVDDLVQAILKAGEDRRQGTFSYNLSDGKVYSRYDMADNYKRVFHKRLFRFHVPYFLVQWVAAIFQFAYKNSKHMPVIYPERLKELTAENWSCDISLAKEEIGYNPNYNLDSAIKVTVDWYKNEGWLK